MKLLYWKNKTGRGFSSTLTFDDILDLENKEDWKGEFLHEWVEYCELGDRWENRISEITCIENFYSVTL